MNNLTIGFIGFGLMAGSIAKAIKRVHPDYTIIATSRRSEPLNLAKTENVIDRHYENNDINSYNECDFIFLCTPVVTITDYMAKLKNIIKPGCIITDIGSVKGAIHNASAALGLDDVFIGGHPMTGSEHSGYEYSNADMLCGARYVITPTALTKKSSLESYKQLITELGCKITIMDWRLHDRSVAGISHLPHLVSAALAKTVKDNDDEMNYMHTLAAGGFRDSTRIAASSPEMWGQICATNGPAICEMMDCYIELLKEIRNEIHDRTDNPDEIEQYITQLFTESRDYRNTFSWK